MLRHVTLDRLHSNSLDHSHDHHGTGHAKSGQNCSFSSKQASTSPPIATNQNSRHFESWRAAPRPRNRQTDAQPQGSVSGELRTKS